jgi:hypothetical protein
LVGAGGGGRWNLHHRRTGTPPRRPHLRTHPASTPCWR